MTLGKKSFNVIIKQVDQYLLKAVDSDHFNPIAVTCDNGCLLESVVVKDGVAAKSNRRSNMSVQRSASLALVELRQGDFFYLKENEILKSKGILKELNFGFSSSDTHLYLQASHLIEGDASNEPSVLLLRRGGEVSQVILSSGKVICRGVIPEALIPTYSLVFISMIRIDEFVYVSAYDL